MDDDARAGTWQEADAADTRTRGADHDYIYIYTGATTTHTYRPNRRTHPTTIPFSPASGACTHAHTGVFDTHGARAGRGASPEEAARSSARPTGEAFRCRSDVRERRGGRGGRSRAKTVCLSFLVITWCT